MNRGFYRIVILFLAGIVSISTNLYAAGPTVAVPRFTLWKVEHKSKVTDETYQSASPYGVSHYNKTEVQVDEDVIKEIDLPLLTDIFIRKLSSSAKFTLIERAKADKILSEIKMGEDGLIDKTSLVQKGKMLGAEYMAIGTLIYADASVEYTPVAYTERFYRMEKGTLKLDLRLLETATGRIVSAHLGKAELLNKTLVSSKSDNTLPKDFYLDLREALALDLTTRVVDSFYPLKAIFVKGRTITADRGKNYEIAVNEIYNVIRRGEPIEDPDTHEVIAFDETKICTARVVDVRDRVSRLEIVESGALPKKGDILVIQKKSDE